MANQIRLKRASGSDPSASDLVTGELAVRTDTAKLFTKKDDNSVAEIGATVADGSITSAKIADGAIVNADVNASAGIAGSKVDPDFGSQNIVTTGNLSVARVNPTAPVTLPDSVELRLGTGEDLELMHSGGDNFINNKTATGSIRIQTNGSDSIVINTDGHIDLKTNVDCEAGIDVTGDITVSGTVDGVDVAALNTTVSGKISDVVDDTSPQLGGDLDLQAFELNTSTSNGNLKLNPNGTGSVEIKGDGSSTNGKVQLNCSQNSHGVKLESPDHSASQSYTIKLPDNQIAADKFLKVKSISGSGSTAIGQLEFADGGGGVTSFNANGLGSNRSYAGLISTSGGSSSTLSTTVVYYLPFIIFEDCQIDGVSIVIDGGTGNSGDLAQIAIYGPVPKDLSNVPKIATTSTFAVDSGYGKSLAITSTTCTAGVYLYSITANTASLSIRGFADQTTFMNYMVGTSSPSFSGGCYSAQYSQNTVTTFPHSYPSSVNASAANHISISYQFMYLVV
tara:strand:+ start:313 stop:1836 length:1524 start_codon:yes stop_codon:yes gene_type:complete